MLHGDKEPVRGGANLPLRVGRIMMHILKTVYNDRLMPPLSYVVECGTETKRFDRGQERQAGEWMRSMWEESFFPVPARVYYNYGFIGDSLALYCEYKPESN